MSKVTKISLGEESIDVNYIERLEDGRYQISYEETCSLLKQGKFNDDQWGQITASYEGQKIMIHIGYL